MVALGAREKELTVKERQLPVISRTEEGDLLNIDGTTYEKRELFERIDNKDFEEKLKGRPLITWDYKGL